MFRAHVLIIRKSKLHCTASGIITPIELLVLAGTRTPIPQRSLHSADYTGLYSPPHEPHISLQYKLIILSNKGDHAFDPLSALGYMSCIVLEVGRTFINQPQRSKLIARSGARTQKLRDLRILPDI